MYFFILASILFHYVNAPYATMREWPTESAEVVSQGYFSEQVNVLEEKEGWTKIVTQVDGYQGWVKSEQLSHQADAFLDNKTLIARVKRCMAHFYHVKDTIYGPVLTLPFDSLLKVEDDHDNRWIKVVTVGGQEGYIQRGDVEISFSREGKKLTPEEMVAFSMQFLGLPYTWGGRSSFGYDCSGFAQMLYRQMGFYIPRNSREQFKWEGFKQISIEELTVGDLIFFGPSEAHIGHVGVYIGSNQFIHSTVAEGAPYIHISWLSEPKWNGTDNYRGACTLKNKGEIK